MRRTFPRTGTRKLAFDLKHFALVEKPRFAQHQSGEPITVVPSQAGPSKIKES